MSKLEQLINELCPNGVEWIELGNILEYEQPTKYIVESTDYDQSYNIPVLTAGQTFILGYTNERTGIYTASSANPTIIFDDFTTAFHWVDFDFKVKSSAMKMLRPKVTFKGLFRYIYYAMKCIGYEAVDHSRHWISKYSHFEIPIPPLPVQEEIVRILDAFTDYTAELQAELQARREQYEYYRNTLLSFEGDSSVEWKKLGEICEFINGRAYKQDELLSEGKYKVLRVGNFFTNDKWYYSDLELEDKKYCYSGDLLYAWSASFGPSIWNGTKTIFHYHIWKILCNEEFIDQKYLYHWLKSDKMLTQLSDTTHGATMSHLTKATMEQLQIVLPPLSEQRRIVAILDKFEALVNDLTEGLPAEIAARQEQYEYYRDKLLSFPKAV